MPMRGLFRNFAAGQFCLLLLGAGMSVSSGSETHEMVRFTDTVPSLGGRNLVPNGSFEAGTAGWSSIGQGAGYENAWAPLVGNWGNLAVLHGMVEKGGAAQGKYFLRIRLGGANTPVTHFDYFYPVNRRELRPLAANLGWIEVSPGEPYTISLSMRGSRDGLQGALGVQNEDAGKGWNSAREEILTNVSLSKRWQRYSYTFVPKNPYVFVLAGPNLTHEADVAVDIDAVQLEKGAQATVFEPRTGVEFGVTPTATAGVFTIGEPAALKLTVFNSSTASIRADIKFRVTDFADKPVDLPGVDMEISGRTTKNKSLPLPENWRGFYRVMATCSVGGTVEDSRLLRLAIVPPRSMRDTVIGVNHAYPTKTLLELAKKAGVSWHRDWSLKWQHIEPEPGKYRWDISDPQINRVVGQGLNLMAMIPFPAAEWNSTAPNLETLKAESPRYRSGGKGDDQELMLRARWAWMPRDVNELAGFIGAAVARYRRQIQVWEFLNEALYTTYSLPDTNVLKSTNLKSYTVRDYVDLLRSVAPTIRAANPDARIMGGGMTPGGNYTLEMVENGLMESADILGLHDYPRYRKPEELIESMDKLRATMTAHGGIKPMWITEFSYFGTDDLPRKPFIPIPALWSESQLHSEKEVADYTIRYATIFLGRGGGKIFLHSGCTGSVNKPGTESCLFADGAVRKIFPALAVFSELLGPKPKYVGDQSNGGAYIFAFETAKRAVVILWDPEEKKSVAVPIGASCEDMMGRVLSRPTISLTGSPVYVCGPPDKAMRMFSECVRTLQDSAVPARQN
jgi:hypothetical protein